MKTKDLKNENELKQNDNESRRSRSLPKRPNAYPLDSLAPPSDICCITASELPDAPELGDIFSAFRHRPEIRFYHCESRLSNVLPPPDIFGECCYALKAGSSCQLVVPPPFPIHFMKVVGADSRFLGRATLCFYHCHHFDAVFFSPIHTHRLPGQAASTLLR